MTSKEQLDRIEEIRRLYHYDFELIKTLSNERVSNCYTEQDVNECAKIGFDIERNPTLLSFYLLLKDYDHMKAIGESEEMNAAYSLDDNLRNKPYKAQNTTIKEFEDKGIYVSIIFARNLDRETAWMYKIETVEDVLFTSKKYANYTECELCAMLKATEFLEDCNYSIELLFIEVLKENNCFNENGCEIPEALSASLDIPLDLAEKISDYFDKAANNQ